MAKKIFFVNLLLLIFTCVYTIVSYFQLPEIVTVHFGIDGKPDGYGSKEIVFVFLAINILFFLLLNYLSKNANSPLLSIPNSLRDNKKLTEIFTQCLLFFMTLLFASIPLEINLISQGIYKDLSFLVPTILVLMIVFMLAFSWYSSKKAKKNQEK